MRSHLDKTGRLHGYYLYPWDFLWAYYGNPAMVQHHVRSFDFGHAESLAEPNKLDDTPEWAFAGCLQSRPLPSYPALIPRGRVAGFSGGVISPDHKLLWDVSYEFGSTPATHTLLKMPRLPSVTPLPGIAAVLTSSASSNYYHWLFDVLARIHLLRLGGIPVSRYIINSQGHVPFQTETLAALGIPREKLIICGHHTHIEADWLVVPSLPGYNGHPPKWACDFLREALYPNRDSQPTAGGERLYISREDAKHRNVTNGDEVVRELAAYGFRIVKLEQHSVREQARLFSAAEAIVAPHGAGLANLIFCRPKTKVFELHSPNYVVTCYWVLSNHVGAEYSFLLGEGPRRYLYRYNDNITVSIPALRRMLQNVFGS